jgi:glycosyltransferase involved in cell wall biosynthesis
LSNSLSLIVPVRDCEATLARQVGRWLDVAAELTQRFEILVVDDGSVDHTFDVAQDLARQFPQIRALRSPGRRGVQQAARIGLEHATGDVVFVQDEQAEISGNDLRRLWEMRQSQNASAKRLGGKTTVPRITNLSNALLDSLSAWGEGVQLHATETRSAASPAAHMPRRGAMDELKLGNLPADKVASTAATDWCEQGDATASRSRTDAVHQGGLPRRGTSFLSHLRELALGE